MLKATTVSMQYPCQGNDRNILETGSLLGFRECTRWAQIGSMGRKGVPEITSNYKCRTDIPINIPLYIPYGALWNPYRFFLKFAHRGIGGQSL